MYLNDLNSAAHNVEKINKVLASTFGHNVNISEMSSDALGRMLTATNAKITQIKESHAAYWENPTYNKLNLIQHSLRTYINEVAPVRNDGKKMKAKVKESAELEQAEVMLAAQELVDELQKMVENLAEMQVQKLMPIVDAMKEQVGFEQAEAYNANVDAALGSLLDASKATKDAVENATMAARGEVPAAAPMPTDMAPADEPEVMDEPDAGDDSFGGDDAAAGDDNQLGRELKGESALADMEKGALAEKKFLESKDKLFKMVESGEMTQEHFINVINELDAMPGRSPAPKQPPRPAPVPRRPEPAPDTPSVRIDQDPSEYGNTGKDYRTMPYNPMPRQDAPATPSLPAPSKPPKAQISKKPRRLGGLQTMDLRPGDTGFDAMRSMVNRMKGQQQ